MDIINDGTTLVLAGEFDVRSTMEVRNAIYEHLDGCDHDLVVDLSEVTSVDVTALKVLAAATHHAERRGRHLTLRQGVVCEDGSPILVLAGASILATFTDSGDALWIADSAEVRCIELSPVPRIRTHWPYPPLRTAAGAPARRKRRLF